FALAVSPDGKALAAGAYQTVRLWDATTGKEQHSLTVRQPGVLFLNVTALAFTPDGKSLAAVYQDVGRAAPGDIDISKVTPLFCLGEGGTGRERHHGGGPGATASRWGGFPREGRLLAGELKALTSHDRLVDLKTGSATFCISRHQANARVPALSP